MLQPKNLKKTQNYFWKSFSWMDFLVLCIITILSVTIGYTSFPPTVAKKWSLVLSLGLAVTFSLLLIKVHKYDCRLYVLLFRAIKYLFSVKKYNNKSYSPKLLVPYKVIIENKFVKTKQLKTGTKYLGILRFQGKSPWNEDLEDRETFLNKFNEWIDTSDYHLTLIRKKELADYSMNFASLEQNKKKKLATLRNNNADKKVIKNYKKYYESVKEDLELLDTELLVDAYYVVLYAKDIAELKKIVANTIASFNSMDIEGNLIEGIDLLKFLASISLTKLNEEEAFRYLEEQNLSQREILVKNNEVYESLTFKEKVKEFFKFLKEKFSKSKASYEVAKKTNTLSLDSLLSSNTTFKRNYFIKDGRYYSIHTISELPLNIDDGWAISLFDNDATIVWNLGIFNEESQASLLDKSGKRMTDNKTLIKSKYFRQSSSLQIEALEELQRQLQENKNLLLNSALMIINDGNSLKELRAAETKTITNAKRAKLTINTVPFKQFEALAQASLIPTDNLHEAIPMSSYNISHGWAFENETNNDNNAFILGSTALTGEPIIFDQFYKKSARRVNYNMFTVGSSGKGKSTDVKKAIVGHLAANNKVYIIDPQNEYTKLGNKFNATMIDLGLGHKTLINPLEVQIQLFNDDEELSTKLIINKHLEWLETYFKLINPDWNQDYIVFLMSILRKLYEKIGLYAIKDISSLKNFKYPIMSDLIHHLRNYQWKDEFEEQRKKIVLANIIDRLSFDFENNGKYEYIYNGQTNINLENDFIIFNTQKLFNTSKDSGQVGLFVLLSFIQNKIFNNAIEDKEAKTVLVIDELHMYIDPSNMATLDFVYTMTKTVRKFNAGMILCTQNPSDFLGSSMITKKAEAILQNCQYAKFFGLKQKDLEAVMDMFKSAGGLNKSHQRFLADSDIGNLIFSLHMYSKIKGSVYYNDFEQQLFFDKGVIGQ
ncbi:conjugal transfer protein TraE [Mycoplasmopsis bovis]|uniref:Mbov_0397 family ICE element conjugal transfer ATPase n=1 Tax=Mycoplasmopsis bovis TaxID=28903 RepID=UPI00279AC237